MCERISSDRNRSSSIAKHVLSTDPARSCAVVCVPCSRCLCVYAFMNMFKCVRVCVCVWSCVSGFIISLSRHTCACGACFPCRIPIGMLLPSRSSINLSPKIKMRQNLMCTHHGGGCRSPAMLRNAADGTRAHRTKQIMDTYTQCALLCPLTIHPASANRGE